MKYRGVILTGTSASGKSTVAKKLCTLDVAGGGACFRHVRAVTTRSSRKDDEPDAYDYFSPEQFADLQGGHALFVSAEYRGQLYGIKRSEIERVEKHGDIPVLTITPESASEVLKGGGSDSKYLSIFMDASDEELDWRLQKRSRTVDLDSIRKDRERDRSYKEATLYSIQNSDVDSCADLIRTLWGVADGSGVLPKHVISLMLQCGMLLENADSSNVQGASYDLSLGDEYFYGGKIHQLTRNEPILMIEPYDYAIVTSHERSRLPKDACGRFDLSVSLFCQGLILSNGPQVDPGFSGPLFCLLFNTSSSPVMLKRRQHYATLEFHKLLEPTESYKGHYQSKDLLHYLPSNAARGAINELKKEVESLRQDTKRIQDITLAVLSVVLALITLFITLK